VRGLWKRGLLPRIIVGWGVGGVIASLGKSRSVFEILKKVCSQTDADMDNLLMPGGVDLSPLSHSEQGTRLRRLRRLFTEGHLFDVKYLTSHASTYTSVISSLVKNQLGNMTFQEAYEKTRRVLNVIIPFEGGRRSILMNFLTTPNVVVSVNRVHDGNIRLSGQQQ
jgi:TAG lipase/lysophosphatidylethanolamine acyltransferase